MTTLAIVIPEFVQGSQAATTQVGEVATVPAEIGALAQTISHYSPAKLDSATRRILLGALVSARGGLIAKNRCGAMRLLDTIPATLTMQTRGPRLPVQVRTSLSRRVQAIQGQLNALSGGSCALRMRTTMTPPGGQTLAQPHEVAPGPPIEFEPQSEEEDEAPGGDGAPEPAGVRQETIEPAPIPAFRDPVRTRATAARSQPTGRQAGDDLRVDQRSESTAGAQDGWPIDPGVASAGDVVVYSGNTFIEVSTKSGAPGTFTHISIQSLTTDTPDLGYNGDQDIVYDPNTGLFMFIDQTHCLLGGALCQTPPAGATAAQTQNRYRLFVVSPACLKTKGCKWLTFDLLSSTLASAGAWFDYPSLALGQGALYLSANSYHPGGEVMARITTAQIRTAWDFFVKTGKTSGLSVESRLITDGSTSRPVQDVGTTGYSARFQKEPTPALIIRSIKETSPWLFSTLGSTTTAIRPFESSRDADDSLSPDGHQLNCCREWVVNGALSKGELWFAFGIGRHTPTFDNPTSEPPRIRLVRVSASTLKKIDDWDVGVPNLASGFPALASNVDGEVAMVFTYGGERLSNNQTGVVLLNSPRRALTFAAHLRAGVPCPAGGACLSERNGDYYKIHRDGSNGRLFSAASYIETAAGAPGSGAAFDFIRFGRGDPAPPTKLPDLKPIAVTKDTYTIANLTGAPVGFFPVNVTYKVNSAPAFTFKVNHPVGLGPLAAVSNPLACFSGVTTVTITVDPGNAIKEANEANNTIKGGPWVCIG